MVRILIFIFSILSLHASAQVLAGKAVYDKEIFVAKDSSYKRLKTFVVTFKGSIYFESIENDIAMPDFTKPMTTSTGELAPPMTPEQIAQAQMILKKTQLAPRVFDYENRKLIRQEQSHGQYLAVYDTLLLPQFILTSDTATISSILCQKAISIDENHEYEFWFAKSIPTVAGPQGISNHPGLVVLVYSRFTKMRYRLVSLEYPMQQAFKLPYQNQKLYTQKQFEEAKAEMDKKFRTGKPIEGY
jgi:GLPGLI family protein